jgi:hypothetical protein
LIALGIGRIRGLKCVKAGALFLFQETVILYLLINDGLKESLTKIIYLVPNHFT